MEKSRNLQIRHERRTLPQEKKNCSGEVFDANPVNLSENTWREVKEYARQVVATIWDRPGRDGRAGPGHGVCGGALGISGDACDGGAGGCSSNTRGADGAADRGRDRAQSGRFVETGGPVEGAVPA